MLFFVLFKSFVDKSVYIFIYIYVLCTYGIDYYVIISFFIDVRTTEVFDTFKDENGNFKACLCEDTKGMLHLYEASYFSTSGERILDEARDFTTKHLEEYRKKKMDNKINDVISILVNHALELPLHWRMLRLEARWFIDVYEKTNNKNTTLLEFAKLDFNIVQAIHQEDLKDMSRYVYVFNSTHPFYISYEYNLIFTYFQRYSNFIIIN